MCLMARLPSEVLGNIFSLLPNATHDVSSLYQCTLVCRRWNSIANVVLWRKPVLTTKEAKDLCLAMIEENPLLASYIQEWPYESKSLSTDLLPYLPNLQNIGYMLARTLKPEKFKKSWHLRRIDHLDYCATDGPGVFQRLVILCPRLERLSIRINSLNEVSDFTEWMSIEKVGSLKYLKVINSEYGVGENQAHFIRGFTSKLPNLQSLEIESYTFNGHETDGLSRNCPRLDSLSIVTNSLAQYQINCIANEFANGVGKRITRLQLSVARTSKTPLSLVRVFTSLKALSELSLHRFELDDDSLESLASCTQRTLTTLKLGLISPSSSEYFFYQRSVELWENFFAGIADSLVEVTFNESFGNFRDMISGSVAKYCTQLRKLTVKHHEDNFVCPIVRGCGKSLRYLEYSECFVTENALSTIFDCTLGLESLIIMEHKHNAHRPKANPLRFQDFMGRSGSTLRHLTMTGIEVEDSSVSDIEKYGCRLNSLSLKRINSFRSENSIIKELRLARPNLRSIHIELVKPWENQRNA
ncbi:hypothetical protein K7432_005134 [Basidiobolus ranarum]|uniref:F-box domain-containing protein n=1 Tax=Basidiobolus ranarum TaxID=34480 RepID=A0ABR2WX06_9FUNG